MDLWKNMVNIPDLDAMAADDDYIHTETLKVTKATASASTGSKLDHLDRLDSSTSSQHATDPAAAGALSSSTNIGTGKGLPSSSSWSTPSTAAVAASAAASLQSMAPSSSASSSWSLLDRKPQRQRAGNSKERMEEATARLNAMVFDTAENSYTNTTTRARGSGSHTNSASQPARTNMSNSTSEASQTQSLSDDDDASQDSYDEDDPILSLMNQQSTSKKGKTSSSHNRFMSELDDRLAQPSTDVENQQSSLEIESAEAAASAAPQRKLWSWQKLVNGNRSRNNTDENGQAEEEKESSSPRPLWARPKKKKKAPASDANNFIKVSSGNMGFSDEEKQALANLKQASSSDESGNILSDHPRESFIALTLVLGAGVYFFARMTAADDLAR